MEQINNCITNEAPCVRIVVASEGPLRVGFLAVSAASSPV